MNKINLIDALDVQKLSLQSKLLNKNLSKVEFEQIKGSIDATISVFKEKCHEEYLNFIKFCRKNKQLYKGWHILDRNTDSVVKIQLNHKKRAILFVLKNTFDGSNDYSAVLVPFEFISSPDLFLKNRKNYLINHYKNELACQIALKKSEIHKAKKEYSELLKIDALEFAKKQIQD